MPRKTTPTPNLSNPRWKTISFQFTTVIAISEYIDSHPGLGYNGVGDFIISKLRLDQEYQRALAEYAVKHDLRHPDEAMIEAKMKEMDVFLEKYRAKEAEYLEKKGKIDQIQELLKQLKQN